MPHNVRLTPELIQQVWDESQGRKMGQCNCSDCRESSAGGQRRALINQVYPDLDFIPVILDTDRRFGNTSPAWQYEVGVDRFKMILEQFEALRNKNRRRVGQWKRHGKTFHYCKYCGEAGLHHMPVKDWNPPVYDDVHVCPTCLSKFQLCDDCGEYYSHSRYHNWRDNEGNSRHVCFMCYTDHWSSCWNCGQKDRSENFTWWNSEEQIDYDDRDLYQDNRPICDSCMQYEERPCQVCGEYLYTWLAQCNDDNDHMCRECYEGCKIIHPWEWKPEPRFQLSKKNPKMQRSKLMYGVELEIEKEGNNLKYEVAHAILEFWGKDSIYAKEDATIENGIELVTHPFSWQQYRDERQKWEELFNLIKDYQYGADGWDNVGMHVHMSKAAFTQLHLYKFLSFMYNYGNRSFVHEIAQRYDHDYALWCSADESSDGLKSNAKYKTNQSDERHSAVNLTGSTTVEVRIFKSTINSNLFHKNLEFLQSLFDFTLNTTMKHINIPHYWKYLNSKLHSNRFRNLIQYIENNNCIKEDYSLFGNSQQEEVE